MDIASRPAKNPRPALPRRLALLLMSALVVMACSTQGSDMNPQDFPSPQAAALYEAAAQGDRERGKQLIANGANPNSWNDKDLSLLDLAMRSGNRRAFETLLDLGADPAALGDGSETAVHVAAILEDPWWLKTLLARGVSPDVRNRTGETPLFAALGNNSHADRQVQALLDAGADIHATDNHGATLLHKASLINAYGWALHFLQAGVDPRATDRLGATFQRYFFMGRESLMTAPAKRQREQVRQWLREHGISVEE